MNTKGLARLRETIEVDGYWRQYALCRVLNTNMFPQTRFDADQAIRVCEACPVMQQCSNYAERNLIRHGVWGGELRGALNQNRYRVRQRARSFVGYVGDLRVLLAD